jgi:hypothetical protein
MEDLAADQRAGSRDSGFIVETPAKLRRIVSYFRAQLGQGEHSTPHCNAPWVSEVIEASGRVRLCFFHEPVGNIRDNTWSEIINGPGALPFRFRLDIASNTVCLVRLLLAHQAIRVHIEAAPLRYIVNEHHRGGELSGFGAYTSCQYDTTFGGRFSMRERRAVTFHISCSLKIFSHAGMPVYRTPVRTM